MLGGTIGQIASMAVRPFRTEVDLETTALLLALLLVACGGWHLVLERLEL